MASDASYPDDPDDDDSFAGSNGLDASPAISRMHLPIIAPRTRGDCLPGGVNEARPCPWSRCQWNLDSDGESCVLDVADQGGLALDAVGEILGLSRERVRQIESVALRKMAARRLFTARRSGKPGSRSVRYVILRPPCMRRRSAAAK